MGFRTAAPEIDSALDSFARSLHEQGLGNYQTIHIEEPAESGVSRLLTWQRGGTTYGINMSAETPEIGHLTFWGNAYRDSLDMTTRKVLPSESRRLPYPTDSEGIQETVADLAKELRLRSRLLNLNGRIQGVSVVDLTGQNFR